MKKLQSRNNFVFLLLVTIALSYPACRNNQDVHQHGSSAVEQTMPIQNNTAAKVYTCPMHPEVLRDQPGLCPICGMDLVERGGTKRSEKLHPGVMVEAVNETVISQIKTILPEKKTVSEQVTAKGYISYNPRNSTTISSRYSGRIENLYVKYNFQEIVKGQKIMDIYSPELVTAQQHYIFLLSNPEQDLSLTNAAKQKLLLLGMTEAQLETISNTKKAAYLVSVYAPSSGHIHQMENPNELTMPVMPMGDQPKEAMVPASKEFSIREGMYVKKGEPVFNSISLSDLWVILKLYPEDVTKVKIGQPVEITSEIAPDYSLTAHINFIEPMFEKDSRFLSARVYLEKCDHHIFKIGSLVSASIRTGDNKGLWIPSSSLLDTGNGNTLVFKKDKNHFKAQKVSIGSRINNEINVLEGLSEKDTIASNAWYLVDSESFIPVK